jgi:hypothetical protein
MAVMDRLKLMLMGKGKTKPDAKEEAAEVKAGKVDSPGEEMLEDSKGRPMRLRMKSKPFGKR